MTQLSNVVTTGCNIRMQDTRLSKRALQYRPSGKRGLGRQRKYGEMQCEDGTGKMPNT
jgi:hypothetical protein